MGYDSYSEAIGLERMETQLARCAMQDNAFPPDNEECARRTAMNCICPCMLCEERICNVLASSICEQLENHRQR